jgi:hypothetical protein
MRWLWYLYENKCWRRASLELCRRGEQEEVTSIKFTVFCVSNQLNPSNSTRIELIQSPPTRTRPDSKSQIRVLETGFPRQHRSLVFTTFITTSLCIQIERVADEIPSTELAWSRAGSNSFLQLDPLPDPRPFDLLSFYVYCCDSISTNYPFASLKVIASARSSSNACATHSLHQADLG